MRALVALALLPFAGGAQGPELRHAAESIAYIAGVRDGWLAAAQIELEAQLREPGRLDTTQKIDAALAALSCAKDTPAEKLQARAVAAARKTPSVSLAVFVHGLLSAECGVVL